MLKGITLVLIVGSLLTGCANLKDLIDRVNIKYTPQCGSEMVDLLDVCLVNWSLAGCMLGVNEAHAECLRTGHTPITPIELKSLMACSPDQEGCLPPGIWHS